MRKPRLWMPDSAPKSTYVCVLLYLSTALLMNQSVMKGRHRTPVISNGLCLPALKLQSLLHEIVPSTLYMYWPFLRSSGCC